jgi:hypothetical protein
VCSGGGRTLGTSVAIMYSTFSALTSSHHTKKKVFKKQQVTTEERYKEHNFLLSSIADKEIN